MNNTDKLPKDKLLSIFLLKDKSGSGANAYSDFAQNVYLENLRILGIEGELEFQNIEKFDATFARSLQLARGHYVMIAYESLFFSLEALARLLFFLRQQSGANYALKDSPLAIDAFASDFNPSKADGDFISITSQICEGLSKLPSAGIKGILFQQDQFALVSAGLQNAGSADPLSACSSKLSTRALSQQGIRAIYLGETQLNITEQSASDSELDRVIPPEIKNDELYMWLEKLCRENKLSHILEIGASSGEGSTEAIYRGIKANASSHPQLFCLEVSKPRFEALRSRYAGIDQVKPYNLSSVSLEEFPSPAEVSSFYRAQKTVLNDYPLEKVLGWLEQDLKYLHEHALNSNGIQNIKSENGIEQFDLVVIDGSEFSGKAELEQVYGAKFVVLDDTRGFKNFENREKLLKDSNYKLLVENPNTRNGYSIFQRVEKALQKPIHFFTIVLNGEPFIRHHLEEFKRLNVPWHWHIVEGVAELIKDTSWSVGTGGHIPNEFHKQGLSIDGTAQYLEELVRDYPEQISVYRKTDGKFWEGKVEMCNAPLPFIEEPCLLWQVDSDELWKAEQIERMHKMFMENPERTGAFFCCYYFVGPKKYCITIDRWATEPFDWPRVWNYKPGMHWNTHEPAILVNEQGQDVLRINPFSRDETLNAGLLFEHYAYSTEAQVAFKERYYGYPNAVEYWRKLQQSTGQVDPADYLPWAKRGAIVEDWSPARGPLLIDKLMQPASQKTVAPKQYSSVTIAEGTQFEQELTQLFRRIRPRKILETGTYHGTGTTSIMWRALCENKIENEVDFTTIEVNPENYRRALEHFRANNMRVRAELGLTLPKHMLPTPQEIQEQFVAQREFEGIYYDHDEAQRTKLYFDETNFNVPDNLLQQALARLEFRPDFVLLDSAGHVGYKEFEYLLSMLKGETYLMCDDIYHCKHHKSFLRMKKDPRFEIVVESPEKFGFCIAKFTPLRKVCWVRTDSIGDAVLSASLLTPFYEQFGSPEISILCQEHIADLYRTCPVVKEVIAFNKDKFLSDDNYRTQLVQQLQSKNFELALHSTYSRDPLGDYLALNTAAKKTIANQGDCSNMPAEQKKAHDALYSKLIQIDEKNTLEIERDADFIRGLGIKVDQLKPTLWLSLEDETLADSLFRENNLTPEKCVVLFAGAQWEGRIYPKFGAALAQFCSQNALSLIALGSDKEFALNQEALNRAGVRSINLCGKTTLRQSAAILKRVRMVVGSETGLAHMACALNVPNVVLLGGGHFGRFFPYSSLTTAACLPLECYGCNWQCKYGTAHCVKSASEEAVLAALTATLTSASSKPRIFLQSRESYQSGAGLPAWGKAHPLFNSSAVEIVELEQSNKVWTKIVETDTKVGNSQTLLTRL